MLQGPKPRCIGSYSRYKQTILYKKYIINHFEEHKIEERISKLYYSTDYITPVSKACFTQKLNRLDTQVTENLISAERKFGSDPLKKMISKNSISQYQHMVRYWLTTISGIKTKQDMTSILEKVYKLIDPEMYPHIQEFVDRPQTGLATAKKLLQEAKALSIQTLKIAEELESTMIAEGEEVNPERISTNRTRAKYTKQLYAQIRSRFKPQHGGGISHTLIPADTELTSSNIKLITNPSEIESCIIKRNIAHFGQAHGTPFTLPPMSN